MKSIITNESLKEKGKQRQQWFEYNMPLITDINALLKKENTFKDKVVAICMHIEPKTGYWVKGILESNAKHVYLVGCLGTTKDDTAAYLASLDNMTVLGTSKDTYEDIEHYLDLVMKNKIDIFLDNGGSVNLAYARNKPNWKPLGSTEETRSGKLLMEKAGYEADYPIVVIDDSPLKQLLENATGVGQSIVDGFMRGTSMVVGGKNVLVVGYGYCGEGIVRKFKGLGANTLVYDKDPIQRLKAKVDGSIVGPLEDLIPRADVIITVTGAFDIITEKHIPLFKNKVILGNSGHYKFEIDVEGIKKQSIKISTVKDNIDAIEFNNKVIFVLSDANPLNLAIGDGNPIEIMDLGLGLQSLSAHAIINKEHNLVNGMQIVPKSISDKVATMELEATK